MRHEFTEILNDAIDYFLLADIRALREFSTRHGLPRDLATEFTSTEAAERAADEGVLVAMPGVENLPGYTVAFVTAPDEPELRAPSSRLVHDQEAYAVRVDHGSLELFTWWVLEDFTDSAVDALLDRYTRSAGARIPLDNGWYRIDILAGWLARHDGAEPAFEFLLTRLDGQPAQPNRDLNHRFRLDPDIYGTDL